MPRPSLGSYARRKLALSTSAQRDSDPSIQPDGDAVLAQLHRILNSRIFAGAHRSQLFLRYIVEHGLAHPDDPLKEYSIAVDVFGRSAYDPAINNTVRVEAGRLRSRLLEYYAGEGCADPLVIEVPRGSYRALVRPHRPVIASVMRPHAFMPAAPAPGAPARRNRWAIPAAFILGAFLGYRVSH